MAFSDVERTNWPRRLTAEQYASARTRFVECWSARPDVVSIIEFGHVRHPGISDLDYLVVLEDDGPAVDESFSVSTFDEETRYILNDTEPFLMGREVFDQYWRVFPMGNQRVVWGEDLSQPSGLAKDAAAALILLNQLVFAFYPHLYIAALNEKPVNVRRLLLRLNAFGHAVQLANDVLGKREEWDDAVAEVDRLRGGWFDLDREEGLQRGHDAAERLASASESLAWAAAEGLRRHPDSGCQRDCSASRESARMGSAGRVFLTSDIPGILGDLTRDARKAGLGVGFSPSETLLPIRECSSIEKFRDTLRTLPLTLRRGASQWQLKGCLAEAARLRWEILDKGERFYAKRSPGVKPIHRSPLSAYAAPQPGWFRRARSEWSRFDRLSRLLRAHGVRPLSKGNWIAGLWRAGR